MNLDDAIQHLTETLTNPNHEWSCPECKAEHEQLAEWLKELKDYREGEWLYKPDLINYIRCCREELFEKQSDYSEIEFNTRDLMLTNFEQIIQLAHKRGRK